MKYLKIFASILLMLIMCLLIAIMAVVIYIGGSLILPIVFVFLAVLTAITIDRKLL